MLIRNLLVPCFTVFPPSSSFYKTRDCEFALHVTELRYIVKMSLLFCQSIQNLFSISYN